MSVNLSTCNRLNGAAALPAAVLAACARDALADAARLIRAAEAHGHSARRFGAAAAFRAKAIHLRRLCLSEAIAIIASARRLYAHAVAMLAKRGQLSHHYAETGARFRAMVRIDGKTAIWESARTYGKRQSAQRAAARHIEKLRTAAACLEVVQ